MAQVDVLDESFGPNNDGTVSQYFIDNAYGRQVAVQSDDKILVSIEVQDFFLNNHKIMRYSADGIIDSTFGTNGIIDIDFFDGNEFVSTLEVLPDDRFLVAGYGFLDGDSDFFVARYLANGLIDNSFGMNGLARFDLDEKQQTLGALAIDANGDLILVGWHLGTVETDALIVKLTSNGLIDSSFDSDGYLVVNYGINDQFNDVIIESDGSILAVGQTLETTHFEVLVSRFLPNGQPDNSLDGDGVLLLDLDQGNDLASKVQTLSNGNLLIGGTFTEFGVQSGGLVQIESDGSLAVGFGVGGWRVLDDSGPNFFANFLAFPNGKILTLGFQDNLDQDIQLYQMDEIGALDTDFGNLGVILTDLEVNETAADFIFQSSGRLIVVGSIDPPGLFDISMLMLRYDVILPVSIETPEEKPAFDVQIIGNPILGNQIHLSLHLPVRKEMNIRIVDVMGRVWQETTLRNLPEGKQNISISLIRNLPEGQYWIELSTEKERASLAFKR